MKNTLIYFIGILFFYNQVDVVEYQKVKINNEMKRFPKYIVINTIFPETCNQIYRYYVINCSNNNPKPNAIPIKFQFK